jgi:hypothetical protein
MLAFRVSKSIKRIVIPRQGAAGEMAPAPYVLKPKRKKKKTSKQNRFLDKLLRQTARSQRRSAQEYLYRHKRSSRKKKNGWLRDLTDNISRAGRKGRKSIKLSKLF